MGLVQYLHDGAPFANLTDMLNWHHGNPLGIGMVAQLVIILLLVEAMAVVNYFIRYRGKSQYYPALYTLLFFAVVAIYYYCFQDGMPTSYVKFSAEWKECLGWFCKPDPMLWPDGTQMHLGWGVAIVNTLLLTHVIYTMLCAVMQVAAQLSVEAKMIEGKKWKEWKIALGIVLAGVTAYGVGYYINPYVAAWSLFISQVLLAGFVIYKIVVDTMRCKNLLWGLLIGLTFYMGMVATMILSLECMRGLIFFLVVIISFLSTAKARKKNPAAH